MKRAPSVLFVLGVLVTIALPTLAEAARDPVQEGYRAYSVNGCSDCHSANPVYGDVVSSASTVEGLLSAIRGVPEMNARYASTLALGAIKRQDIAAYIALVTGTPPPPANYTGLWWASPAGSESGWGISLAHQGDVIFAT